MTDEEFAVYRDGRYAEMLKYYDKHSVRNQLWYRICSVYVLAVSALIAPIVTLSGSSGKLAAAIIAPTVTVMAGIASLFLFHENWLRYRATWDALTHEIHWRAASVGDYANCADRNATFVTRVESLISQEGREWLKRQRTGQPTVRNSAGCGSS